MRATSPASTGEHTPGRMVYYGVNITVKSSPTVLPFQAILRKFAQDDNTVFARPLAGRGNPEDWCTDDKIRVILNAVKPLRQGLPLSVAQCAPPLPLQRESILPEG